jgi:hypothetical protein
MCRCRCHGSRRELSCLWAATGTATARTACYTRCRAPGSCTPRRATLRLWGQRAEHLLLHALPLLGRPAPARPGLCNPLLGLRRNGHAGQFGQAQPEALVADRCPGGILWPLCRPQSGRRHRDGGCWCQDPASAGLAAPVAEAEADPVGEPRSHLEILVAFELLPQALQGLGRAVVLQAEDDPVAGLLPHAKSVGLGDPVELARAVAL